MEGENFTTEPPVTLCSGPSSSLAVQELEQDIVKGPRAGLTNAVAGGGKGAANMRKPTQNQESPEQSPFSGLNFFLKPTSVLKLERVKIFFFP